MTRTALSFTVALMLVAPAGLNAQACLGLSHGTSKAVAGQIGFPSGAKVFGLQATTGVGENYYLRAAYGLTSFDNVSIPEPPPLAANVASDNDGSAHLVDLPVSYGESLLPNSVSIPNHHHVGMTGAYEFIVGDQGASICPQIGLGYGKWSDQSSFQVPVGVGIGMTLPFGLTPNITPQLVWTRSSLDGASTSETNLEVLGGATYDVSSFLVGGAVSKTFKKGHDAVFSVQFGFRM